ncbi:hypothetical protein [uncultured Methanobrevibacter sp.]|uniref:hypothetical protein n=1 Tax=uncultured Methanobrevibacter sp. TaxID=253161 RepID=UPI0025CD4739|nr:hypothetical protein [uncultured Methanobrevibacter sp.]
MFGIYNVPIPKIILEYEFIDNLDARFDPLEVCGNTKETHDKIKAVAELFKKHGWEGDGEIKLIWLPPFLDEAHDPNFGEYIWHVKQNNNGTSFLGFQDEWQSARLLDQNPQIEKDGSFFSPESLVNRQKQGFLEAIKEKSKQLDEIIRIFHEKCFDAMLKNMMLSHIQNDVIAIFSDFIDEVYFELAHAVFFGKKANVKLTARDIKLNLEKINDSQWLTIHEVVNGVWNSFKFLPFKQRLNEILRAIDYKYDESEVKKFIIHNEIRNCFQHHMGVLVNEELQKMGLKKLKIRKDNNKFIEVEAWNKIELTIAEIKDIIISMEKFVNHYELNLKSKIKIRNMFVKKQP